MTKLYTAVFIQRCPPLSSSVCFRQRQHRLFNSVNGTNQKTQLLLIEMMSNAHVLRLHGSFTSFVTSVLKIDPKDKRVEDVYEGLKG